MKISYTPTLEGRGLKVETNEWALNLTHKVSRRINALLKKWSLCQRIKIHKLRKNSNCFLTADYIAFWNIQGLGTLDDIVMPEFEVSDEELPYPYLLTAENSEGLELHSFIALWEIWNEIICFHQRGDKWRYEFLTLSEIMRDWQRPPYHDFPLLETHATNYRQTKIKS